MMSCKEISRLVSESFDRELSWRQRANVRLHLLMCSMCSRFRRQMRFLREASRILASGGADDLTDRVRLSSQARERIKLALARNAR